MVEDFVQVKADVPRELKRRAFAALALREEKFNHWLRRELEAFLQQTAERASEDNHEQPQDR